MKLIGNVEGHNLYARWEESRKQVVYTMEGQDIAVYDIDVMKIQEDPIVFRENTIANELSAEAKDKIQQIARTVDISELIKEQNEYGEEVRDTLARTLNLEDEEIISITEVSLDEEVEKDEKDLNKNEVEKQEEKEATVKDINIKQEISMDAMATSMKTVRGVLERAGKMPKVDGKTFSKIGIVESSSISNIDKDAKNNITRFSLVAIATDGTVVPLDLEQDYESGTNPRETNYIIRADGRVEQDDVNSRYKIGNSGETLSIKYSNGPGNIEVAYSPSKTLGGEGIDGNESIDHQLQTSTVYWKPRKESMAKEYTEGKYGTENRAREAYIESKHDEGYKEGRKGGLNKNTDEYKNLDGDLDTKEIDHEDFYEELAKKIISEDQDVEEGLTEEEVVKMLKEAHDKGTEMDEAAEDIKEYASRIPKRHR